MPQWSPSGEDGTTSRSPRGKPGTDTAAMEPVRRGRDDLCKPCHARVDAPAAMEPVRRGRDDPSSGSSAASCSPPQWSPSGEDGTTPAARPSRPQREDAAMEPVRRGRDDRQQREVQPDHDAVAAMEPVRRGRDDRPRPSSPRCSSRCRNGARPERTGRRDDGLGDVALADAAMEPVRRGRDDPYDLTTSTIRARPQWSPSGEDGTTCAGMRSAKPNDPAAMEPVRRGRDDFPVKSWMPTRAAPQWSPSGEDGTTSTRLRHARRSSSRNGARPERTGRRSACATDRSDRPAAMEPVRRGRDD